MDMGPLYSAEHRDSVIRWIDKGEAEGAELVVDGRPFHHPDNPDGFFLGVTLFDHVTPDMEIYQEEIFGPVLGIVRASDLRRGARPRQRPQVRQRHGDLHDRRRRRPALQARGRRADDRGQRPDPGPGRLPLVRRRQGVRPRRPGHARRGRHPLLHPAEDGHRALAGARQARRPQPGLPRQQLRSGSGRASTPSAWTSPAVRRDGGGARPSHPVGERIERRAGSRSPCSAPSPGRRRG